jgi:hypothetical protein
MIELGLLVAITAALLTGNSPELFSNFALSLVWRVLLGAIVASAVFIAITRPRRNGGSATVSTDYLGAATGALLGLAAGLAALDGATRPVANVSQLVASASVMGAVLGIAAIAPGLIAGAVSLPFRASTRPERSVFSVLTLFSATLFTLVFWDRILQLFSALLFLPG